VEPPDQLVAHVLDYFQDRPACASHYFILSIGAINVATLAPKDGEFLKKISHQLIAPPETVPFLFDRFAPTISHCRVEFMP
jgi:hypothetical protein